MDKYALAAKDQLTKKFDEIEDILDCLGPIDRFPKSLLKARIDALSLLLSIELEMAERFHPHQAPPVPDQLTH